jgi:hypothetical protein
LQLTPAQLEKLELELLAESNRRVGEAMARTIRDRGSIPRIVLDEPDKDAQRKRLLAELGNPEFWIERPIIDPPADGQGVRHTP